jgi:hypothetical protein
MLEPLVSLRWRKERFLNARAMSVRIFIKPLSEPPSRRGSSLFGSNPNTSPPILEMFTDKRNAVRRFLQGKYGRS